MPCDLLHPPFLLFSLFLLFGLCFLIQMAAYWGIFLRLAMSHEPRGRKKKTDIDPQSLTLDPLPGVSVVICAHNAHHHLIHTLPQVLEQDYPDFEVVVVDHASDDDTEYLLSGLSARYGHLKIVTIKNDLNFFSGKKFPLSIGIKTARKEIILLTDADCRPSGNQWIRMMSRPFANGKDIVLGYGAYEKRKGILNALIRFDTAQVAVHYLSFALAGIPYMGVGRNLAYRKSLFYGTKGFISHYKISSGDDDLFVNRVAKRKNTAIQVHPDSFTYSEPKATFGQWFIQKRRHLTTAVHYRFQHRYLLALLGLSRLLFWALLIILLSLKFAWIVVLSVLLFKWASQYVVMGTGLSRLHERRLIAWIPVFEWPILLMQLILTGSNLFSKPRKWK